MPIPYTPMTEKEDSERNLTEKGDYRFVVDKMLVRRTKDQAHSMVEVEVVLQLPSGEKKIKDWMVLSDQMKWKLRHFAKSIGQLEKYDLGILEERDCLNQYGLLKLGQKLFTPNDGNDPYMVNNVLDYLAPQAQTQTIAQIESNPPSFGDKDVPF